MKKNICISIAVIICVGLGVTYVTSTFIDNFDYTLAYEPTQEESTQEEETIEENMPVYEAGSYEDLLQRFYNEDIAMQVAQEENKDASLVFRQNVAKTHLKYWETQHSSLYNTILEKLTGEEAAALVRDEQDFQIQKNDISSDSVSQNTDSAYQGLDFIESQTTLTRNRTYYLLEKYKDLLN